MNSIATQAVQTGLGIVRGTIRTAQGLVSRVTGEAFGTAQRVRHSRPEPKPGMDDVTLARKVETELFRPEGSPKGSVDVNVVSGVVYLRGEVKRADQIEQLELRARKIPEVVGVENLLHTPKTPAPTRS